MSPTESDQPTQRPATLPAASVPPNTRHRGINSPSVIYYWGFRDRRQVLTLSRDGSLESELFKMRDQLQNPKASVGRTVEDGSQWFSQIGNPIIVSEIRGKRITTIKKQLCDPCCKGLLVISKEDIKSMSRSIEEGDRIARYGIVNSKEGTTQRDRSKALGILSSFSDCVTKSIRQKPLGFFSPLDGRISESRNLKGFAHYYHVLLSAEDIDYLNDIMDELHVKNQTATNMDYGACGVSDPKSTIDSKDKKGKEIKLHTFGDECYISETEDPIESCDAAIEPHQFV